MRYTITAPNPEYTGVVASVMFVNGSAEVDSEQPGARRALAYFRQAGYDVTEVGQADEPADEVDPELPPLPAKTAHKPEWVAAAVTRGMTPEDADKATKEQLIELLSKPEGNPQS